MFIKIFHVCACLFDNKQCVVSTRLSVDSLTDFCNREWFIQGIQGPAYAANKISARCLNSFRQIGNYIIMTIKDPTSILCPALKLGERFKIMIESAVWMD